jgi:hypothetical protein
METWGESGTFDPFVKVYEVRVCLPCLSVLLTGKSSVAFVSVHDSESLVF